MKPRLTERYFLDPLDFGIKSERLQMGDLIHPIFMDAIAMNLLAENFPKLWEQMVRPSLETLSKMADDNHKCDPLDYAVKQHMCLKTQFM